MMETIIGIVIIITVIDIIYLTYKNNGRINQLEQELQNIKDELDI